MNIMMTIYFTNKKHAFVSASPDQWRKIASQALRDPSVDGLVIGKKGYSKLSGEWKRVR